MALLNNARLSGYDQNIYGNVRANLVHENDGFAIFLYSDKGILTSIEIQSLL